MRSRAAGKGVEGYAAQAPHDRDRPLIHVVDQYGWGASDDHRAARLRKLLGAALGLHRDGSAARRVPGLVRRGRREASTDGFGSIPVATGGLGLRPAGLARLRGWAVRYDW